MIGGSQMPVAIDESDRCGHWHRYSAQIHLPLARKCQVFFNQMILEVPAYGIYAGGYQIPTV